MKSNTQRKLKRNIRLVACILFFSFILAPTIQAQKADGSSVTVSGKVTDSKNAPLEGVSIIIKGTNKGVVSNAQGLFTIKNVPENAKLVLSTLGFLTIEHPVKSGEFVSLALTEQLSQLSDVVVTGYGSSKKKDLTGAITQVKATQFENENPKSVQDMLRGNAAGLDVGFDPSTKG